MSLHRDTTACEWHCPPLAEDAGFDPAASTGRTVEWRGGCDCGWLGAWRGTSAAADRAKADYREHVEQALGAQAYVVASVACRNCGVEHEQGILVGTHVMENTCTRCGTKMLQPYNDAWDESRANSARWSGF